MSKAKTVIVAVATALLVTVVAHAADWEPTTASRGRPTLSGCTSACTLADGSIESRGRVSCTDGPVSCTVTFSSPERYYPPVCVFSSTITSVVRQTSTPTTTAFTFPGAGRKRSITSAITGHRYTSAACRSASRVLWNS